MGLLAMQVAKACGAQVVVIGTGIDGPRLEIARALGGDHTINLAEEDPTERVMGLTDGIGADLWNEARTALFKSNDAGLALPFARPLGMLAEAARYASRALRVKLGVLEVGAAADLVVTDYRPATPLSADNLAAHLIFAMGPECVRDVMVDGRWVLRDAQVCTCDEQAERARLVESSRDLHARMAAIPCE